MLTQGRPPCLGVGLHRAFHRGVRASRRGGRRPWKYIFSFYGWVDLLSILPTFVELLVPGAASAGGAHAPLLRVFRVLKLVGFLREAQILREALLASRRKIAVFLSVLVLVTLLGTLIYMVEGASWVHKHPTVHLLGNCDRHHRGVRRHCAPDRHRPNHRLHDDSGVRHPRGAHRHCGGRAGQIVCPSTNTQACPSCGREGHDDDAVQALWRATSSGGIGGWCVFWTPNPPRGPRAGVRFQDHEQAHTPFRFRVTNWPPSPWT